MKTYKAFATLAICVLLALNIATFVNLHKVSAQLRACRKIGHGYIPHNNLPFPN